MIVLTHIHLTKKKQFIGYSNWFIDNTLKKFEEHSAAKNNSQKQKKISFLLSACRIWKFFTPIC